MYVNISIHDVAPESEKEINLLLNIIGQSVTTRLLVKALPGMSAGICRCHYAPATRGFLRWLIWRAWREMPRTPPEGLTFSRRATAKLKKINPNQVFPTTIYRHL